MAATGGSQFHTENCRQSDDGLYMDLIAWTPDVREFRDMATSRLLEHPYELSIISLAMPNLHIVKVTAVAAAEEMLHLRVSYMLGIVADNRQKVVIIGMIPSSYDTLAVASYFQHWLNNHYASIFMLVTFATLDAAIYRVFSRSLF